MQILRKKRDEKMKEQRERGKDRDKYNREKGERKNIAR